MVAFCKITGKRTLDTKRGQLQDMKHLDLYTRHTRNKRIDDFT